MFVVWTQKQTLYEWKEFLFLKTFGAYFPKNSHEAVLLTNAMYWVGGGTDNQKMENRESERY